MKLHTKTQWKHFEKGEFTDEKERTLTETWELIHQFPWKTERISTSVELTGPSITIERGEETYLKLGHFFHQKFIFYFCHQGKIWEKPLATLEEFTPFLQLFFDGSLEEIKSAGVKKGWIWNAPSFFRTHPFVYEVNTQSILRFLRFPVLSSLAFYLVLLFPILSVYPIQVLIYLFPLWLLFSSGSLLLLFNYYQVDRFRSLILSKGNDTFWFGDQGEMKTYVKSNIKQISKYAYPNRRGLWPYAMLYEIEFHNGEVIHFSSLLLPESWFNRKLANFDIQEIPRYFPKYG